MPSILRQAQEKYEQGGAALTASGGLKFLTKQIKPLGEKAYTLTKLLDAAVEFRQERGAPLSDCVIPILHGWKPEYYAILGLTEDTRDRYLTRDNVTYPWPFRHVNKNAYHVLQDKLALYSIFDTLTDHFPALYGTIHDGEYVSHDGGRSESLVEAVDEYGGLAVKPVDREQGKGFYKITSEDGTYSVNGVERSRGAVADLQRTLPYPDYMATRYVTQADYAASVYPETTNTIRLLTVRDPETGEPTPIRPVHRWGTGASKPVDNFDNGGVLSPIDAETGRLEPIVRLDERGRRTRSEVHPETGKRVAGVEVPTWERVRELAVDGANAYPNARLIGWDFVITEEKPMILEASGQPSVVIPQIEEGLLAEPVARRLFEETNLGG